MSVSIRMATSADARGIFELVRELAIYEKAEHELWLESRDYEKFIQEDHFECIVAELDREIVGIALFYPTFSTWKGPMLHLEDFVVSEKHRRKGVGDLIFRRLMEIAKERSVSLVKWEVLEWNTPAIQFYEKYETIFEKDWWNIKVLLKSP